MNKIIAAFDSLHASDSTMDYAVYLAKEFNAHIVAAFLRDILYHGKAEYGFGQPYEGGDFTGAETALKIEEQVRNNTIEKVKNHFNRLGVPYSTHHDPAIAIQSLISESHFADMILVDADDNFSGWDKTKPSHFLKNLLADADCPIMVVPKYFKPIEKVVFAYDGSSSSMYAMRLFTYLFPKIVSQQIEIVLISHDQHSNHLPEHQLLKELLKRKYPVILQSIVKSEDTTDALAMYLQTQTANCMAVLGSYQRSALSRWLHQSTADALIAELNIPLFIAHN